MAASGAPSAGGAELERALERGLAAIERREQTAAQVRRRLERAGTGPTTVAAAMAWLIERRYVDDAGYAERFTADRRELAGWGSERIRRGLEAVGVDRELIDAALGGRAAGEELAAAVGLLEQRMSGVPGDDRERRRALGLLGRRGYEPDLASAAVRCHFGPAGD